jgi:hypothetical protein
MFATSTAFKLMQITIKPQRSFKFKVQSQKSRSHFLKASLKPLSRAPVVHRSDFVEMLCCPSLLQLRDVRSARMVSVFAHAGSSEVCALTDLRAHTCISLSNICTHGENSKVQWELAKATISAYNASGICDWH